MFKDHLSDRMTLRAPALAIFAYGGVMERLFEALRDSAPEVD